MYGELCVMTTGLLLMPMWFADSWAILEPVSHILHTSVTGLNENS